MYFDNLSLLSLLVFLVALGAFVYSCLYRNCITNTPGSGKDDANDRDRL
ncbi:MAG TPA: hypothetical protein VM011_07630 [Gammaproteobacteria bacterium]|nr:hypothetical protein [Gammaproteobacteria bacterium]